MRFREYRIAMLVCILLLALQCMAFAAIPDAPTEDIYLADFAGMVEPGDRQQILEIGNELDRQYGAQVVVVTVATLDGQDIESYANQLFRKWGIGDKEKNNGVLLLIAKEDRKFRIEVGYGLEGAITDGYAGSVLDSMKGDFRSGKYSSGIIGAYGKLTQKVYEEYGATPPEKVAAIAKPVASSKTESEDEELTWGEMLLGIPIGIALIGFFFWLLWQTLKLILVPAALLLNLLSSGRINIDIDRVFGSIGSGRDDDDHFGGFSSSSHSSHSSHSGGGFGGGRSGGGGASGGW